MDPNKLRKLHRTAREMMKQSHFSVGLVLSHSIQSSSRMKRPKRVMKTSALEGPLDKSKWIRLVPSRSACMHPSSATTFEIEGVVLVIPSDPSPIIASTMHQLLPALKTTKGPSLFAQ